MNMKIRVLAALLVSVANGAEGQQTPTAAPSRSHAALPKGKFWSWFTTKDYPKVARKAGASGRVTFVATIDQLGRVEKCTIVSSSGNADLDAQTCRLLKSRADFVPATDEEGRAVSGQYTQTVNWQTGS
jgi:protein TonB